MRRSLFAGKRWLAGLAPSLLTLLLLPTGAEWYARRALNSKSSQQLRWVIPGPLNCIERSALLGLEFAPNCSGVSTSGAPLRTNELGLRDEPIADDGARRILIVGDSCTFG